MFNGMRYFYASLFLYTLRMQHIFILSLFIFNIVLFILRLRIIGDTVGAPRFIILSYELVVCVGVVKTPRRNTSIRYDTVLESCVYNYFYSFFFFNFGLLNLALTTPGTSPGSPEAS